MDLCTNLFMDRISTQRKREKIKIKKKNYCRRIWCQKFHWKPKSHCSSELREASSVGLKVDTTDHDHPCKFYFGRSAMESMEPIINISRKELSKEKCDHLFTFYDPSTSTTKKRKENITWWE